MHNLRITNMIHTLLASIIVLMSMSAGFAGEDGWIDLFDGKTLNGWENPYTKGKAIVVNGEIHLTATKGKFFLCTVKQYADFIFEGEVKLPKEGKSNSGFMFRCHKKKNKVFGYQAEVDPTSRGWSGGLYDEGRRGWIEPKKPNKSESANAYRAKTKGAYKHGEWNKYKIQCEGKRLRTWVNGVACIDLEDATDAQGYIGIQHHGEKGQTYCFRNLRIKILKPATQASVFELVPNQVHASDVPGNQKSIGNTMGEQCPKNGTVLFGKDGSLSQWLAEKRGGKIQWTVADGVMTVAPRKGSIMTKDNYANFKLHLEFNINKGGSGQSAGNSGIYIHRRYELQILNSHGQEPIPKNGLGSMYRQKAPDVDAGKPAGEWQVAVDSDIAFKPD